MKAHSLFSKKTMIFSSSSRSNSALTRDYKNTTSNEYIEKYTICRNFYDLFRYSFKVVFSPNN